LAKDPRSEDRPKFVAGVASLDLAAVRACLAALEKLPAKADLSETAALIHALGALPEGKEATKLRGDIAARLRATTKQTFGPDQGAWLKWFATVEPKLAAKLT